MEFKIACRFEFTTHRKTESACMVNRGAGRRVPTRTVSGFSGRYFRRFVVWISDLRKTRIKNSKPSRRRSGGRSGSGGSDLPAGGRHGCANIFFATPERREARSAGWEDLFVHDDTG